MATLKQLHYSVVIDALPEKVWKILWSDKTYSEWTSVFSEGSYAVSDWKEGSKIHFLTPAGDGMYSTIQKLIPNKYMSFHHHGVIKNFKEQPLDKESEKWSGSAENYTLKEKSGKTLLEIDLDATEEFEEYFQKAFPKAIQLIKQLAEEK